MKRCFTNGFNIAHESIGLDIGNRRSVYVRPMINEQFHHFFIDWSVRFAKRRMQGSFPRQRHRIIDIRAMINEKCGKMVMAVKDRAIEIVVITERFDVDTMIQ